MRQSCFINYRETGKSICTVFEREQNVTIEAMGFI